MAIFAFIILLLGAMVLCSGIIWFVVNAFRASVLWGIAVCLFTPTWLRFAICHWDLASRPLLVIAAGALLAYGGGQMMPASASERMLAVAGPFGRSRKAEEEKEKPAVPSMFAAQKEMELKIKLTALSKKENDLLMRKSEVDPKDEKAVAALKAEIVQYNEELQPLLLQMKEQGMQTAAQ